MRRQELFNCFLTFHWQLRGPPSSVCLCQRQQREKQKNGNGFQFAVRSLRTRRLEQEEKKQVKYFGRTHAHIDGPTTREMPGKVKA